MIIQADMFWDSETNMRFGQPFGESEEDRVLHRQKSCGAIVFREKREVEYLLLRYSRSKRMRHWGFVKGLMEKNESEIDTVMRELKEETGIAEAHFVDGFRDEIYYFFRRGRNKIYKDVVYFLIQAQNNRIKLSPEHIAYKWLDYQRAIKKLTFKNTKSVLRKAHAFLKRNESLSPNRTKWRFLDFGRRQ